MASDLPPYALFGENVSENVVVSNATKGDDNGSPGLGKSDQGFDVHNGKEEAADISGDWIANGNNDLWSAGYREVGERDWVLNDKMGMSPGPKEKLNDGKNLKGDNLDAPGLGQRGFSREPKVKEMDFKATFASITEWFDHLAVDSEELEATAHIESQNTQFDMKYWLAELWEIGHSNLENMCTSGGKPGSIVREDNVLFAEWGKSNPFQKISEELENQRLLECKDYGENVNARLPKDKANHANQKILSPSWNAVDIMLDFRVPENPKKQCKEHGECFGTKLGSSLNRMSGRIGNLAHEAVDMGKGIIPLRAEENDIISKLAVDGQWLEHVVDMGMVLEETNIVPTFINPHAGVLRLVKENSLAQVHQRFKKVDIAEHTQYHTGTAFTNGNKNGQVRKNIQFGLLNKCIDQEVPGGLPHEAIFFTLAYLSLQDLLSVERVCKSLRAAVKNDELLWRHLHVEHPVSKKLTNDALLQLSARAQGHLQCLSLVECLRITDDGLKLVLDGNPNLTKLCLPGCTRVSAEGIVQMVKSHTENRNGMSGLKHLMIRGLYGLTKEHLDNLNSSLDGCLQQPSGSAKPQFYHNGQYSFSYDDDRSIDVEICPKCENARLVYDCTRERCQQRKDHKLQQCRGCILCIARCEECGRCIDDNEYEETFCLDLLCSSCWLQLPKCLECNRPGCGRHADHFMRKPDTSFVCGDCRGVSAGSLGSYFHGFS